MIDRFSLLFPSNEFHTCCRYIFLWNHQINTDCNISTPKATESALVQPIRMKYNISLILYILYCKFYKNVNKTR